MPGDLVGVAVLGKNLKGAQRSRGVSFLVKLLADPVPTLVDQGSVHLLGQLGELMGGILSHGPPQELLLPVSKELVNCVRQPEEHYD